MNNKSFLRKILDYRELGLVAALILLLVAAKIFTPAFYSFDSISSMLTNNAVYAILAVGVSLTLITGGIDISIGAILAVSGISVTQLMIAFPKLPSFLFVIIGILIGCLCGFLNGFLIGKMKIVPMIVTLGTMYIYRGLAYVISNGEWAFPHMFTKEFMDVAQKKFLGFNAIVLWTAALLIVSGIFLGYTKAGRRLYAVGSSEESSVIAGVNTSKVKLFAYVLCGACAGLAGVLYSSNYAMINSDIGSGYEMTAIAICILGGVSITGGRGRIDGITLSAIVLSIATYLLSLLPGFSVWKNALQGGIIIVAVIINITNGKLTDRRMLSERGKLI